MLDVIFRTTLVERAYKYWLEKCPPGQIPGRGQIDPIEMVDFLPNIMLMDVQREPLDFRFRVVGTSVVPLLTRDYTSEWISQISSMKSPSSVWTNCSAAVEMAQPVYAVTPYTGPKRDILDVEDIILPLAADGKNVDKLLIILACTKKIS